MVNVKKALFPISGDPITNGHLNIIERASKWVNELIVVTLENDAKSSALTLEERVRIIKSCLHSRKINNVTVDAYSGLLSDYATHSGVFHIIRGIRNADDLEYEIYLEYGHKRQNPKLEFIYFLSDPQQRTTSSTIARSILKRGGQIKDYVPLQAKQAMEEKIMKQFKLIVTGGIASGKTYITQKLIEALRGKGYLSHNIDFDQIVKHIYQGLAAGEYQDLAEEITNFLGKSVLDKGKISQLLVSREVFSPVNQVNQKLSSKEKLDTLLSYLRPYINSLYHQELASKKGLILLNIPLAAESKILHESNNNVLLIESSPEIQEERLIKKRKIKSPEARLRIERAGSTSTKKKLIKSILSQEKAGVLLTFNNRDNKLPDTKAVQNLMKKILNLFPSFLPEDQTPDSDKSAEIIF